MCPSCMSGALGPGYMAAFAVCVGFFILGGLVMILASRNGNLDDLEQSKYNMLRDEE